MNRTILATMFGFAAMLLAACGGGGSGSGGGGGGEGISTDFYRTAGNFVVMRIVDHEAAMDDGTEAVNFMRSEVVSVEGDEIRIKDSYMDENRAEMFANERKQALSELEKEMQAEETREGRELVSVSSESIEVPAGKFSCQKRVIRNEHGETAIWIDRGMIVRIESKRDGKLSSVQELVEYKLD